MKAPPTAADPNVLLDKLQQAISRGASEKTCHARWSSFIRARDQFQCVLCPTTHGLQAHHICRKSFMPEARFMPGNGITLCQVCHKEVHRGFNGRADMSLPMDAQGGEKLEVLTELFDVLAEREAQRSTKEPDLFYYLSEQVLATFRRFQGYDYDDDFGCPTSLAEAAAIWRAPSLGPFSAVLQANAGLSKDAVREMILSRTRSSRQGRPKGG